MTLIEIIQRVCKRVNLDSPVTAIGSSDLNILRMIELANEEGEELSQRYDWQALVNESTFVSVATETQGAMTTLAGTGFDHIQNDTIWNRNLDRKWLPVDDVKWQRMKANSITGANTYFRLRGNNLLAIPVPTAGQTIAFEWVSKYWCENSTGTAQGYFQADTDIPKLSDKIMLQGTTWRWKKEQGLEYAEDFRIYEMMVANAMLQDGAKSNLNMGSGNASRFISNSNLPEGNFG